jgi:hypothetical protein
MAEARNHAAFSVNSYDVAAMTRFYNLAAPDFYKRRWLRNVLSLCAHLWARHLTKAKSKSEKGCRVSGAGYRIKEKPVVFLSPSPGI